MPPGEWAVWVRALPQPRAATRAGARLEERGVAPAADVDLARFALFAGLKPKGIRIDEYDL